MGARNARSRALAIIGVVGVITFTAVGAYADVTVRGDVAAWRETHTAFKKLSALSAYRVKITSFLFSRVTDFEIVRPNSTHFVSRRTIDGRTDEVINVNGQIRRRTTGDPGVAAEWRCLTSDPPRLDDGFVPFEFVAPNGTVDVSRGPDTVIDGTPVRAFQYLFVQSESESLRMRDTIYVDKANGLPRRMVNASHYGNLTQETVDRITDFYDYGANIVMTLPACK
jgi:hypothetical protein